MSKLQIPNQMTLIILAGGRSRRFGQSKTITQLNGKSLLERAIDSLSDIKLPLIIITSNEEQERIKPLCINQDVILDLIPGTGVIGAIYTALMTAETKNVFVVGCDMPFLNVQFIEYMISLSGNYDAIVPSIKGILEPLHSIYSKNCLPYIQNQLNDNVLSIRELYKSINVKYVCEDERDRFDPNHVCFININRPEDLNKAINTI